MLLAPTPVWDPSFQRARDLATARTWAWLLGFSLPLSGGFTLSLWIPGYPDQVSIVRLVTLGALLWLVGRPLGTSLPKPSARMIQAFCLVLSYAAFSLAWSPDLSYGLASLVRIALALATALAVLLVVRERRTLRAFGLGLLVSLAVQIVLAAMEVATGVHFKASFTAELLRYYGVASVEGALGRVAWGSLGNPNDLGGYLLAGTAVFLTLGAYGIALSKPARLLGWGAFLLSVAIGLTYLNNARAYRLGLVLILGCLLMDRVMAPGRTQLRVPVLLMMGGTFVAVAALWIGPEIVAILQAGQGDALRLFLIAQGVSIGMLTGGFGRGLGTEQALVEGGVIPLNFHNVVVQLAAELGLVVAGAFLVYLLVLLATWAFVTRSARVVGSEVALARATLSCALLIYGVTSSGVLESPHYWAFFALTAVLAGVAGTPRSPGAASRLQNRQGRNGFPSSPRGPAGAYPRGPNSP